MAYSFLQNFCSLLEIYTAIFVSMFLDEILINIWTPKYKQEISLLIKKMNIPAINYFVVKVENNIDVNAKEIREHMKRKAVFLFVFCMSLLFLAGVEVHSTVLPKYGYMLVTVISAFALLLILFGRWMFCRYTMVVVSVALYLLMLFFIYFTSFGRYIYDELEWLKNVSEDFATFCFLTVATLPILWQLFLIWVYSKLYKGFMQAKISKEAYIYGKAYIAYKIKDMAALPKEYEMVARDFVAAPSQEQDTSLHSLNIILVKRLEVLCNPPHVLRIIWSWIKYWLRGGHNPEAEYIEQNGFDYESMQVNEQQPQGTPEPRMDEVALNQLSREQDINS